MKIQLLYDASDGTVIGIRHAPSAADAVRGPVVAFTPKPGHGIADLDVPLELEHLHRARLHAAIRVDTTGHTPRIVAVQ